MNDNSCPYHIHIEMKDQGIMDFSKTLCLLNARDKQYAKDPFPLRKIRIG